MEVNTIRLSWPVKELSGNHRMHEARRAKYKRAYRREAWILTLEAGIGKWPGAILTFRYFPPDRKRRDAQNLPIALKSAIDGIADAIGCDDQEFQCIFPPTFEQVDRDNPRVEVDIEPI